MRAQIEGELSALGKIVFAKRGLSGETGVFFKTDFDETKRVAKFFGKPVLITIEAIPEQGSLLEG